MRSLVVLALLVAGCSSAAEAPAPFSGRAASSAGDDDDDDDDTAEAKSGTKGKSASAPAAGGPMTYVRNHVQAWVGQIASTPRVDFGGGGGFCNYQVVLTDIRVQVMFDVYGHIISSNINNTTTETTQQCEAEPLGVQANRYIVQSPKAPLETMTVQFKPNAENLPQAEITLTLDPVDANHIKGHLVVQRLGGVDPSLNWDLDTDVELTPLGG